MHPNLETFLVKLVDLLFKSIQVTSNDPNPLICNREHPAGAELSSTSLKITKQVQIQYTVFALIS
jgi:hypothetical protein